MASTSMVRPYKAPSPGGRGRGEKQRRPTKANVPYMRLKMLSSDNDIHYSYKMIKSIGEGSSGYSETFEVEDVKNPQRKLAMKVTEKREMWAPGRFSDQSLRFYKEMLIVNKILPRHQNIVEVKDLLISKKKVYLCTELCSQTAFLEDFFECADNTSGRRVFQQLCEAVRFMHQHGVLHLNLRCENVLFSDDKFSQCKIVDFTHASYDPNLARLVHEDFFALEWLLPKELASFVVRRGSPLDDIKALGRILHGILCGRFDANVASHALESGSATNVDHPPQNQNFDDAAFDLLKKIGPRPYGPVEDNNFPSMDTICHHPWTRKGDVSLSLLNDLNEQLSANWKSFTVMADHLISGNIPLRVLNHDSEIEALYRIIGNIQTDGENTRLFEVIDESSKQRLAMKVAVRKGTSISVKDAKLYFVRDAFSILTEVLIMWRLLPRHEHIIELKAVLVSRDCAYFVTPLCERNTLAQFLPLARNDTAKNVFRQLAETVRFMHQYGVVHMDLRPEHVLFRDMDLCQIEITNFSRAAYVAEVARSTHNGFKASKWFGSQYMQMASKCGKVTADIRALGRILHAMICGHSNPGLGFTQLVQNQGRTFDDKAFNLLFKIGPCPIGPAEDRKLFSVEQICNHEWLMT